MITETREIYKCEHCRKMYQLKRFAEAHEKSCSKNPDNHRACYNCKHLCKNVAYVYNEFYDGSETEREVELLYCDKKEVYIYPPSVEHKKSWFELGDLSNKPMPKECDKMELKDYLKQDGDIFSLFK